MKKTLIAIAAAATLGLTTLAAPQPAQARHGHIGGAILAGLAAGAILGAAAGPYYYGPGPYYAYGPGPYAYGPGPVYYGGPCYWTGRRYWNGYGWHWRRVRVCD